MLDYESAAINRYTRTFRDPELEKGYLEDRRPNANADPYVIATVMIDTVCSAASS